jgi:Emfourin
VAHLRVEVEQTGGFAGVTLRQTVDTAELSPGAAAEVERLVAAAERAPTPEAPPRPVPDAAHYELTIERDGETTRLRCDEPAVATEIHALIGCVRKHARAPRGSAPPAR